MAKSNDKMVANNKKAYHDYFIAEIRSKRELLCTGQRLNHSVWENAA